ncbi:MAG: glycosyltransferase [Planctomycetes bacterium]|nr:glycosyltransferase [Planctomycetota bacterium]
MRAVLHALLLPVVALLVLPLASLAGVLVLLVLTVVDLVWWPVVVLRRRPWQPRPRDVSAASIVTVTWNGKHHLEGLLPSLRREVEAHGGDHQVIVVDNGSTDGTVAWLRREHPWVEIVALPENRYFVRGNRAGVERASRDVLIFLNNDMVVRPGFLAPLLDGLRDPRVFAVAAEVFFKDPAKRREETGRTRGELRHGWLKLAHVLPSRDERELDYVPVLWAGGGSAAFDRAMYDAIGGFDTLYDPFYMEDMGLSYEAWKRGFRVLFTARSSVLHEHRGTSRKAFGDDYVDAMIRRNQHLFLWRNLTADAAIAWVLLSTPWSMLLRGKRPGRSRAYGLWFEFRALLRALPRLPEAALGRCRSRLHHVRTDGQVFPLANSIAAHRRAEHTVLGRLATPDPLRGRRILVLSARLPRLGYDGSWTVFRRLVLQAKTHRMTLFGFVEPGDDGAAAAALRAHGIEVVTAVRVRNAMPGNLHHSVPARLWRDYSAPAMRAAVVRALESVDHDLVQIEYPEMLHLLRDVPKYTPWLYTCHESLGFAATRQVALARGLPRLAARFRALQATAHELVLLQRVDHVIALSDADTAFLRPRARGLAFSVVPCGGEVDTVPTEVRVPEAPATVLFVGYFRHGPNVDAALWLCNEILPHLHRAMPTARVRLVGRDAPPQITALAARPGVEVAGYVPDLAAEMAAATAIVLPLRQGSGLRGKLLEAWTAGKAVVGTRVACEGTAARDGEHCLVADAPAEFAQAIVRLLGDAPLRARLGAAGRELALSKHGTAGIVAEYETVYDALAGGAR